MMLLHVLEVQNQLGECILWDTRVGEALWIDIVGARFWCWTVGGEPISYSLTERPGSFALTEIPGRYLGAFESGFAWFEPLSGAFELVAPVTAAHARLRMNDGRVDRAGRFWAGSMAEAKGTPLGSLWRYDGAGAARAFLHDIRIPNALCWSLDGRRMYFADSKSHTIMAYDFDAERGPIGAPRVFATTFEGVHPDGACVDAEDHLWNAQWNTRGGTGTVVRYRPDGTIERCIELPVSQPSCVAFGGAALDLLFVSTARIDLTPAQLVEQPLAGALFIFQTDVKGVAENRVSTTE